MKLYEITLADQEVNDDLRISLVEHPAVELTLMKFNKEDIVSHYFSDQEKRIVFSVAMIPNKLILRSNIKGEPAEVFYTPETVEKFRNQYFTSKRSSNLYHRDSNVEGINVVESWIVEDPETDKSKAMGFSGITKGTWMVGMKINNDEVWNDHIKTGKITGFSIEGHFNHELKDIPSELNNKQTKMKKETTKLVFEAIRKIAMASDLQEFTDGEVKFYAVDLEVGSIITDAEGNPMANAELKQNDRVIKTDDMGAILADDSVEVAKEEMVDEVVSTEVENETSTEDPLAKMQAEMDALKAENEDLKAKLAEAEAAQVKAEESLVTMSKHTLSAKPIGLAPVQMTAEKFSKMSVREKFEYERSLRNK